MTLDLPARGFSQEQFLEEVTKLRQLAARASSEEEVRRVTSRIAQIARKYRILNGIGLPSTPIEQALEVNESYRSRPHLELLSDRLVNAVRMVERGQNQRISINVPPRSGKSTLTSLYTPLWILRRHPEWKIALVSYSSGLVRTWAKELRSLIEADPTLGIALKADGGAGGRWTTIEGGGMFTTEVGGDFTGYGAKVLIIDDPIKDYVAAHNPRVRQQLWDWWLTVASTRMEGPFLQLVTMTRWHTDDFVGRLFSDEWEGDPRDWEKLILPALADRVDDPLGRKEGQPLYSPLMEQTEWEAKRHWREMAEAVGTYGFTSMFQQRPAPSQGAIFDAGWWRYWTRFPENATEDGRVTYLDPETITDGQWVDSWDFTFKGTAGSDWVVGQRWVKLKANRYLIYQVRKRLSFTQTLAVMRTWATDDPVSSPCGRMVHTRLVEDKANGPAIIDSLKDDISGIKPINPKDSKEARARAVTPEVESGNVILPYPYDPGNEWVIDLESELRNFPHDANDDQVDGMTQALLWLRDAGIGMITVPGRQVLPKELRPGLTTQLRRDFNAPGPLRSGRFNRYRSS